MIPIPSGVYKWLAGGIALMAVVGAIWLHGRSAGIRSMADDIAEVRVELAAVVSQRDAAREETADCYLQMSRQSDAVAEWERAAEDYRRRLHDALSRPPRTVYRDVVLESEDCTDAVVEMAEEIASALR